MNINKVYLDFKGITKSCFWHHLTSLEFSKFQWSTGNCTAFNALELSYDQSFVSPHVLSTSTLELGVCFSLNKGEGDPFWYICLENLEYQLSLLLTAWEHDIGDFRIKSNFLLLYKMKIFFWSIFLVVFLKDVLSCYTVNW